MFAVDRYDLVQGGNGPDNRPIVSDPRTDSDDAPMQLAGAVGTAFDRIAGQCAPQQFGDAGAADRIELVMASPGKHRGSEMKGLGPARVGGDVAQLVVEDRDARGDLVDEMPHPVRG